MNKRVAIMQSNYIPWKGYFDMINMVDEFILFDDVQYTKKSWRNRNQIVTKDGLQWLTIPVDTKGKFGSNINEIQASSNIWRKKHWRTIESNYKTSQYFKHYADAIYSLYNDNDEIYLSRINYNFLIGICQLLNINTKISFASDYDYQHIEGEQDNIIKLIQDSGAKIFLNGPAAKAYMSEERFADNGIDLIWMEYTNYPEYTQLYGKFEPAVSILDLLFNIGPEYSKYMKSFNR
jgi:hypothetical protein